MGSTIGLHARPARIIAQAAQTLQEPVLLSYNGQSVVASSPLLIMSLGAEHDAEVTVSGTDAGEVEQVAELVASNLDSVESPSTPR